MCVRASRVELWEGQSTSSSLWSCCCSPQISTFSWNFTFPWDEAKQVFGNEQRSAICFYMSRRKTHLFATHQSRAINPSALSMMCLLFYNPTHVDESAERQKYTHSRPFAFMTLFGEVNLINSIASARCLRCALYLSMKIPTFAPTSHYSRITPGKYIYFNWWKHGKLGFFYEYSIRSHVKLCKL